MKKLAAFSLAAFFVAILAYGFFPGLLYRALEYRIESDCSLSRSSPDCLTRMRAMGNSWSFHGDLSRAERWYQLAAVQGDAASMFDFAWINWTFAIDGLKSGRPREMGRIELSGNRFLEVQDKIQNAFTWYSKAASLGFAPAMNNLGEMYSYGLGAPLDPQTAFRWHMAAAQARNPAATWNIALAYAVGQAGDSNQIEAAKYLSWNPKGFSETDLMTPILERTLLFGNSMSSDQLFRIREAAKENVPIQLTLEPMRRNNDLPVFQSGVSSAAALNAPRR